MSWRYGILTAAAVLALLLVVADFVVGEFNRSAQIQISARQQFINQSIELSRVNQTLVHALAIAAVRHDDPKLRALLAGQGITVNSAPPAAAASATPPAPASSRPAAGAAYHPRHP